MLSTVSDRHSRRSGIRSPRSLSTAMSRPPATIHRIAAMNRGGIVSSAMRIPNYVVPQIRQTAIQPRYGRELWWECGSAIVRIV